MSQITVKPSADDEIELTRNALAAFLYIAVSQVKLIKVAKAKDACSTMSGQPATAVSDLTKQIKTDLGCFGNVDQKDIDHFINQLVKPSLGVDVDYVADMLAVDSSVSGFWGTKQHPTVSDLQTILFPMFKNYAKKPVTE